MRETSGNEGRRRGRGKDMKIKNKYCVEAHFLTYLKNENSVTKAKEEERRGDMEVRGNEGMK